MSTKPSPTATSLSKAIDREISAFNADRSGGAAYWKAMWTMEMAETRKLRAMLADAGIDPNPEVTAAIAKATEVQS